MSTSLQASHLSSAQTSSINNPMAPFFGNVDDRYKQMYAEDKFAHETYNLPKAYEGKNKHLETVLDYLITEEDAWYTSAVLPWVLTDDLSVKWEIFRFNKTLMDLEPHQGVPRYVTAERESRSDRLVRRGLAFIIEHGFYKTDQGRQHYLMNLRQIVDSVNETAYHGVIHALLSCKNHYKEWNRQHGPAVSRPGQLLRAQRRRWALVQKQERGLYLLDAELKDQMKYEGVKPDIWILPSKMSIYVTMVPSAEVEYYRKGAGAAANLEKGPANMLSFRGSQVFETRPFDIDFIGEPRDLLVRERQIGEFYTFPMLSEVSTIAERDIAAVDDGPGRQKKADLEKRRSIFIYDMESDDFEVIKYKEMADIARASYKLMLESKRRDPNVAIDIDAEAPEDQGTVMLCRPFMTYLMASAILMKGGLETGFTAHGHHDFMLTDDVIHKVHIGHYTFYHKSVVKQPKNVMIAEDIFAHSYVGGEGTTPFTSVDELVAQMNSSDFMKDLIPIWVTNKHVKNPDLTDAFTEEECRAEVPKITNPLSLTGFYGSNILNNQNSNLQDDKPHYPMARDLSNLYRFGEYSNYTGSDDDFLAPIRHLNTICFQGHQLTWNKQKGAYTNITMNTGHWGPNVYPGCRSVRNGENTFLKDMEYAKYRVGNRLGIN